MKTHDLNPASALHGEMLFGTCDVALALGLTRQCVTNWASRGNVLPAPFTVTSGGHKRWRAADIAAFAEHPPTARLARILKPRLEKTLLPATRKNAGVRAR